MEKSKYGITTDYYKELLRIIDCVKKLREQKSGKKTKWIQAAEWHMKYSNLNSESSLALTITLSPTGCDWARQGGCTMCGEFEGAFKRSDLLENPQFHISQFVAAITNPLIWETARKEKKPITWIRINQEGNFTNPNEMNKEAQEMILRLAMHIDGVKRITIESRPQYLSEPTVSFLSKLFKGSGVELEIGMGLEAQDDIVRNICINKQGSKKQFIDAVNLLKEHNILPLAYIILKPPFLTEQEAIEEAVATAHFAAKIGFNRISFEPMSIHRYTLVDLLKEAGYYKAPWLWSVIEVAKQCSDISNMFGIGGVGYYPIPTEYTHNYCDSQVDCNKEIVDAIMKYNVCRDTSVFNDLDCSCKQLWLRDCSITERPLLERIHEQMSQVEKCISTYSPAHLTSDSPIRNQRIIIGNSQK